MSTMWKWILGSVAAVVVIFALGTMGSYGSLNSSDQQINGLMGSVRVQEQARYDKIPNLVRIAEGSANFERGVLVDVTAARTRMGPLLQMTAEEFSNSPELQQQFLEAQQQMSSAMAQFTLTVENYPELKSVELFGGLMAEVSSAENKIAKARQDVQEATVRYNTERTSFPFGMIAVAVSGDRFKQRAYFESTAGSQAPPVVELNLNN